MMEAYFGKALLHELVSRYVEPPSQINKAKDQRACKIFLKVPYHNNRAKFVYWMSGIIQIISSESETRMYF